MSRKKLWTTLSTILRRSPRPVPPRFSLRSISQYQSSPIFTLSSSVNADNIFLEKIPRFSGKSCCFCSDSSEKIGDRCWNCNSTSPTTPFLFCESCRSIQPLDHSVDYFQIFGLEKKYEFDDKNLEGMYKDWQKKLHPDLVHSKSENEREYAAEQSARVIDAYRTLKNPLSRAIYILNLEGVVVDEEQTVSELDLLDEILEIREAVEEAANSQSLKKIQSQIKEKLKHWSKSFANAFQRRNFEEAKTSIQRMTYYERVNEEIVKKL